MGGHDGQCSGCQRNVLRGKETLSEDKWRLLQREWHVLRCEQNALKRKQEAFREERDALIRERNRMQHERDVAFKQRDAAENRRDVLESERQVLERERELHAARSLLQHRALVAWEQAWTLRRLRRGLQAYGHAWTVKVKRALGAEDLGVRRTLGRAARAAYRRLPLPDRVRWWLTVGFFGVCGPMLRDTQAWHSYQQKRLWREKVHRLKRGTKAAQTRPAPPRPRRAGKSDLIFWSIIDWEFRHQRPQHLAAGLAARGHRVFYVSVRLVESADPGFFVEPIDADAGIYGISLCGPCQLDVYGNVPDGNLLTFLQRSLGAMLAWAETDDAISVVEYPFWYRLAQSIPGGRVCFDCMDHLAGFPNVPAAVVAEEDRLLRGADAVVVSAAWLHAQTEPLRAGKALTMIRNACEYEHFARQPERPYRDPQRRKVIGYYGAIAEWFDVELVRRIARRFSDCAVLLVGRDTAGVQSQLSDCPNVDFVGEVPYDELPKYLYGMDVCTIPFQLNDLTRATNPVKAYEYLCSGRPVVSIALPELESFDDQVFQAHSHEEFLTHVENCLSESPDDPARVARREFAAQHTWANRVDTFATALEAIPLATVSVIVVTYNNLDLTKACLASLENDPLGPPHEVIVVDNASTDGTADYLTERSQSAPWLKVILNNENRGFAAANNQGLAVATGDFLVLLNNDTVVTPGWAQTLASHLRSDPQIGAIGPISNNIGNEARVAMRYETLADMPAEARANTCARLGHTLEIPVLAFFCVMFPRETYETVGSLDENFGRGFFEDDDYCQRIRQLGKRLVCAEDVFVHHHLSASFSVLADKQRQQLFEQNRAYYESKWGPWTPHSYRCDDGRESVVPASPGPKASGDETLQYHCNICGHECETSRSGIDREASTCPACHSTLRMRAIIHLLSSELFGWSCSLPDWPADKAKRGLGLSDWAGYAHLLAEKSDYTNTFYDTQPRVDILQPPSQLLGTLDFLISSDVFDHVAQPVQAAFDNSYRLLKPGGVLILTVPYDNREHSTEYACDLTQCITEDTDQTLSRIDWRCDDWQQRLDDSLERTSQKRLFCERDLLDRLQRAGFADIRIDGDECQRFGIVWSKPWSLPVVARRAA